MKKLIYIFSLFALLSCGKEDDSVSAGKSMDIMVTTPDVTATTKSELTDPISSENLYVYAEQSVGSSSYAIVGMPGAKLQYNNTALVWNPMEYVYDSGNYRYQPLTWDNTGKSYYRFYGFAYTAVGSGAALQIQNATYGRQFTITQPESDGSSTVDYLLSSIVNVAPTNNYPLVPIELEHAFAKVEVDVQIALAMFDGDVCRVHDISVSVSKIRRKATMLCQQPKMYGAEGTNSWYITFEPATRATYTQNEISNDKAVNLEDGENNVVDMEFMAIPVTNAEMADTDEDIDCYVLTLGYNNTQKGDPSAPKDYTYSFKLKDYSPNGWVNSHKVKYVLTIDNSIHLKASVVDYQDVDYIEAVLVPDIPGTI